MAGFWLAVAVAGQLASLLLIEAGPGVRYQHYAFGTDLLNGYRPFLAALLGLQACLVIVFGRRAWPAIRVWLAEHRKPWAWLALGIVFLATSSAPSRSPLQYGAEIVLAGAIQLLGLATVLLYAASLEGPTRRRIDETVDRLLAFGRLPRAERTQDPEPGGRVTRSAADQRQRIDALTLVGAAWIAVLGLVLGYFSYQWHPHIPDEVAYLLQSRYMASGLLSVATFPVPEAFTPEMLLVAGDRSFSIFPPGWPALLALGQFVGAPWLINPLLAAACVLLTRLLVGETHGAPTARLCVLLLCVSPWLAFMAMSFMAHLASLAFCLLGAWATARARRGAPAWAVLAGAAVGGVSLVRPLEGVIAGLALGLWIVWPVARRIPLGRAALFGLSTVAVGATQLAYNVHLTGDPLLFPVMAWSTELFGPGTNSLGFGPDRGFGWEGLDPLPGHGPVDVLINADLNASAINVELFGWVSGSLFVLAMFILLGPPSRRDMGYVAAALWVIAVQSLYWFSGGPDFGARYWYFVLIPGVLLTARGSLWLRERVARPGLVPAALCALVLASLTTFFPWRAIDKYRGYRQMRPGLERLAREAGFGRDLILIRGPMHPDFHAAVILNPLRADAPGPLYAWDSGDDMRARLRAAFPDRGIWVLEGPSLTGGGYRIIEQPSTRSDRDTRRPSPPRARAVEWSQPLATGPLTGRPGGRDRGAGRLLHSCNTCPPR